jgi:hypothetical protein
LNADALELVFPEFLSQLLELRLVLSNLRAIQGHEKHPSRVVTLLSLTIT